MGVISSKPGNQYVMRPLQATSAEDWAKDVLGQGTPSRIIGKFNSLSKSMEGVQDTGSLVAVICSAPIKSTQTTSFVCVGGPAARYVDVHAYPGSFEGISTVYQGWDGEGFRDGPAINTGGYYWYRKVIFWNAPFSDSTSVFFAKTHRHPNDGSDKSFQVWAFSQDL